MSHWLGTFNDLARSTYFHFPVFSINSSMCTPTECSFSYLRSKWKLTTLVPKDSWQLQSSNGTPKKKEKSDGESFTVTRNIIHRWHVYNVYPSDILHCSFSLFTVSSCTSSISSHPLFLPIPKPKQRIGKPWEIVKDPVDLVAEWWQNGSGQSVFRAPCPS